MADPYRVIIEREIRERRKIEVWYRQHRWADWPDLRAENLVVLRSLIEVRREAKRGEARVVDPITAAKAMTEGERQFAWGR